jgi:hypothetical protein
MYIMNKLPVNTHSCVEQIKKLLRNAQKEVVRSVSTIML